MSRWRAALLVAFFVGLAALKIAHGVYRISSVRERQLAGFVERLERRHAELALDLRGRLAAQRDHAAYLARMPSVRELLAVADAASRKRAEADVAAYVTSFRDIDRVALLDAAGIELARCERIGGGVGTLPVSRRACRSPPGGFERYLDGSRSFERKGAKLSKRAEL